MSLFRIQQYLEVKEYQLTEGVDVVLIALNITRTIA